MCCMSCTRLSGRVAAIRAPTKRALLQLREDNDALKQQVAKLAALVDHYFAAWQETRTLLERRERELSELRRAAKPKVVSIRS